MYINLHLWPKLQYALYLQTAVYTCSLYGCGVSSNVFPLDQTYRPPRLIPLSWASFSDVRIRSRERIANVLPCYLRSLFLSPSRYLSSWLRSSLFPFSHFYELGRNTPRAGCARYTNVIFLLSRYLFVYISFIERIFTSGFFRIPRASCFVHMKPMLCHFDAEMNVCAKC